MLVGSLYIVSTPIGNLKDITLRALETLKSVDVIACEDTRTTHKLLNHYDIKGKKLISHHDKNELNSSKGIINLIINNNLNVALVSDAGTPLVSDPGFLLVREAIKNNIQINIIPGPSAQISAMLLSNFNTQYTFLGFLTPKKIKRQNLLKKLATGTYVIYVSPHKVLSILEDIIKACGAQTEAFLVKELTKLNEKHYRGTISSILDQIKDSTIKGEYTLVLNIVSNNNL